MTDAPVTIRDAVPADAPALAATVIDPIVTTFRGRVPDQCLTWLTHEESAANWRRWFRRDGDDQFLLVAEHPTAGVVGCALGGPQADDPRYDGELFLLGVLPAYQRQGIGRALVRAVAARLQQQGATSLRVGVLSINPHRRFYERLGARFLHEQPYDWNGVVLQESFFGWADISILTSA
jgi:ribosomal protein S18 acetylase RimI-like enzyme